MFSWLKNSLLLVSLLAISACSSAPAERQSVDDMLAERGYAMGPAIDKILRFRVNGWNYVDRSHVIVTVDASRRYLVKLRVTCNGLLGAEVIAFTNTVSYLTTFDSLLVKDPVSVLERCPIESMNELTRVSKDDS